MDDGGGLGEIRTHSHRRSRLARPNRKDSVSVIDPMVYIREALPTTQNSPKREILRNGGFKAVLQQCIYF